MGAGLTGRERDTKDVSGGLESDMLPSVSCSSTIMFLHSVKYAENFPPGRTCNIASIVDRCNSMIAQTDPVDLKPVRQ